MRDAATVMLVRDNPTLEVFMLRRNPRAVFGPGAYVFPGGGVDIADDQVPTSGRARAVTDRLMSRDNALRWWAAAAREAFEEAGFLLANGVHHREFDAHRNALNAGEQSFKEILNALGTSVAANEMHLFSHWLTPPGQPRRYDTWFLVAAAPEHQIGAHDNSETVASEWVRPIEMVERWRRDEIDLIFPTMRTLLVMSEFDSSEELLGVVRAREADGSQSEGTPLLIDDASGERIAMTAEECAVARRGWRNLEPSIELDGAHMLRDYEHRGISDEVLEDSGAA